ncbi:cytochrome c oxidase assembly protein COX20, mitochondrial [Sitophilus oryzae]|uniref:Cytochrome c oxidase assembly protein COX20, mitochondrial n=1 Tax=Sitophilus oryzae TaxID=7048 RepID=A0A6J2XXU4_SITOR|nr:cytochrome c oxidase assembly protein COX20, mitochondrial [Sitophilus oryzae]XP_030755490.1 cytochrome c oxidase assembly protein COX20, mitochondrial [Sitophilus oryzae]
MADEENKGIIIFGRDVSKIPCFRNSFLYGIGGGVLLGLTHFLFTSKAVKSVNYSVYSFSIITLGYWIQCRYEYTKTKFEMLRLQEALANRALFEGTEEDRPKEKPELVDV